MAIETQPIPDYRKATDVAREARRRLWRTRAQAWPCWLGFGLLSAATTLGGAGSPAGMMPPGGAAVALTSGLGMTVLIPFTARILLGDDHPWRLDRSLLRTAGGLGLVFVVPYLIELGLSLFATMRPSDLLSVLLTAIPTLAALALLLWPFGAAVGDESFTAGTAIRLAGRASGALVGGLALMMLTLVLPVMVAVVVLDGLRLLPVWVLSGVFMAAGAMCWCGVLASVYGLWRVRRDLAAGQAALAPPLDGVAG